MGLFGGPRREVEPEPMVDRSMAWPYPTVAFGDFASLNAAQPSTAMRSVAVRSTVDLIASAVSELPIETYSGAGKKIATPGNVMDPGGDGEGVEDWLYRLVTSWLLSGNAYGAVTSMAASGRYAMTADLFNPDDVSLSLIDGHKVWRVGGKEFEDQSKFLHRRANPVAGRVLGLSAIEAHAAQIGVSLSATQFGRQWFTDGAHPSGILTNEARLSDGDADQAKRRLMALTQGSAEPLVLGKGWEYKTIQVSPEESQFLETAGYSEAQCARIFGPGNAEILGYPTGSSMTYANVVDRRQDWLVFSVNKWVRRAERMLSELTPVPRGVKLNREALLEATTLQRYQAHVASLAWTTVNEVREIERMDPIEGGDKIPGASAPAPAPPQQQGAPDGTA